MPPETLTASDQVAPASSLVLVWITCVGPVYRAQMAVRVLFGAATICGAEAIV